jgi:plasmid maintenance system antidote protein VapI
MQAAKTLNVSCKTVSEIANGRAAILAKMTLRFELAFDKRAKG